MNICISFLSFSKNAFGGIENYINSLSEGFISNGHRVTIYSSYIAGNETKIGKIEIYRSRHLPMALPIGTKPADKYVTEHLLKNAPQIIIEIKNLCALKKIDLFIAVDPLWGIIQITKAWKVIKCPIILSLHVVNSHKLLKEINQIPYSFVTVVSNSLKTKIDLRFRLNHIKIIPNSINTELFAPKKSIGYSSNVLFCNSRLAPGKGIEYLIKGFYLFQKKYPNFKLWLCGGQSPFGDNHLIAEKVARLIKKLSLVEKINFLPDLKWKDIPTITRRSFAVIIPTRYETFGRATIETLSCGVPLVVTDVGDIRKNIRNNALFIPYGNSQAISETLINLVNNKALYRKLSERGNSIAKKYDNKAISELLLKNIKKFKSND